MQKYFFLSIGILFLNFLVHSNFKEKERFQINPPTQPLEGPGGAVYSHQSVKKSDFADFQDGYWLYEPADPKPETAPVIVFTHGYGAYNPMIYGAWIKHLVRKGNIVIFPRYQKNLMTPKPTKFASNVSRAIRDALAELKKGEHVKPKGDQISLLGHSYGGVISADLGVNYETYNIPKPAVIMACSPGTGPFKGGRLDSYEKMPADIKLLITVSENDRTVGDEFGILLFKTTKNTPQRNLIRQYADYHGRPAITAGHNECYALDMEFDTSVRNFTAKRALNVGKSNAVDYYGYWKLFDALLDCHRNNNNCEYAFGNTTTQSHMGTWSDGTPLKPLEVTLP